MHTIPIKSHYHKISVNYSFDITFIQDTVSFVRVICAEEFQNSLRVQYIGDALILDSNLKALWLKGYPRIRLEIHLQELPYTEIFRPCSIVIPETFRTHMFYLVDWGHYTNLRANVQVDFLRIDSSGDSFGTYQVGGSADNAELYCRGSAIYDLSQLVTDTCRAYHWSVSDMHLQVKHFLDANLFSSGNILVSGNPFVSVNGTGTGRVIKLP